MKGAVLAGAALATIAGINVFMWIDHGSPVPHAMEPVRVDYPDVTNPITPTLHPPPPPAYSTTRHKLAECRGGFGWGRAMCMCDVARYNGAPIKSYKGIQCLE